MSDGRSVWIVSVWTGGDEVPTMVAFDNIDSAVECMSRFRDLPTAMEEFPLFSWFDESKFPLSGLVYPSFTAFMGS